MKKLAIISLVTFLAVSASARIHVKSNDPKGLESTEYRYDYSDGKKTEIVCNSVEDIGVAIRNLTAVPRYGQYKTDSLTEKRYIMTFMEGALPIPYPEQSISRMARRS